MAHGDLAPLISHFKAGEQDQSIDSDRDLANCPSIIRVEIIQADIVALTLSGLRREWQAAHRGKEWTFQQAVVEDKLDAFKARGALQANMSQNDSPMPLH